ncbi:MAG: hypothetical protein WCD17_00045 [Acinetobacter calcoaceticus]
MNEYYTSLAKRIASGDLSPKDLILWQQIRNLEIGKFKITNGFTSQSALIGEQISIDGGLYEVKYTQVTPSIPDGCAIPGY